MATQFTLINSTAVGSTPVSSVTFNSIPSTYTDLLVKMSVSTNASGTASANGTNINFNGVTTNRLYRRLEGNGSSVSSDTNANIPIGTVNASSSNYFSNQEIYIPNYNSCYYKSTIVQSVVEYNSPTATQDLVSGLWSSTAAITSLTIYPDAGSFIQYSTFYLYGIKNS